MGQKQSPCHCIERPLHIAYASSRRAFDVHPRALPNKRRETPENVTLHSRRSVWRRAYPGVKGAAAVVALVNDDRMASFGTAQGEGTRAVDGLIVIELARYAVVDMNIRAAREKQGQCA